MHNYTSTGSLETSLKDVGTLISLAKTNNTNRSLFLKLAVVLIITKFEVFVEDLLNEILFSFKGKVRYKELPHFSRLNSIMIYLNKKKDGWIKTARVDTADQQQTINFFKSEFSQLTKKCNDDALIGEEFQLKTEFPMGKHGGNEIVQLFKQFEGKDIFSEDDFNKINSLLNIRHRIIHQDATPSLTETDVANHKEFILSISLKIDSYVYNLIAPPAPATG